VGAQEDSLFEVGEGKAITQVWYREGHPPTPVELEFKKGHSKDADRIVMFEWLRVWYMRRGHGM